MNLGPGVNSAYEDCGPTLFNDRATHTKTLYFTSNRPGGVGGDDLHDIYASTRTEDRTFGPAVLVPELSTAYRDTKTALRSDGLEMLLTSDRPGGLGGLDIWASTRETPFDPWSEPVNLGDAVNTGSNDGGPALSADGNTMFFYSNRPGGLGGDDLYMSTRLDCSGHTHQKNPDVVGLFAASLPTTPAGQTGVRIDQEGFDVNQSGHTVHAALHSESEGINPTKLIEAGRATSLRRAPASGLDQGAPSSSDGALAGNRPPGRGAGGLGGGVSIMDGMVSARHTRVAGNFASTSNDDVFGDLDCGCGAEDG